MVYPSLLYHFVIYTVKHYDICINSIENRQYVRATPAPTVGQKQTGGICKGGQNQRACRGGMLLDNILDWEHDLPDKDLDLAYTHSW